MNGISEDMVVPALIAAIVGIFIGYFFGRRSAPGSEENRELQRQLDTVRDERSRFEQRVNEHFADTAGKLNTLTENYREVYEQIATGAAALCSQSGGPRFEALAPPAEEAGAPATIEADSVVVEPPRDYAPKTDPDGPGVLDESFGIDSTDTPPEHDKDEKA